MRPLNDSRLRWQVTTRHATSLDNLKKAVKADGFESPCIAGLRSVCWKTFLLFHTTESTGWSQALTDSRSAYQSLRDNLLRFIENPAELAAALDPLDDDQNSPWNTLRQDEEIRAEIFQDVERCMPDEPYFRRPETQRIMLDILFVFCKINQDVGYRQGMHEILAPILWVIETDAILNTVEGNLPFDADADSLIRQTLDSTFIEHDAFTILSLIMRSAKSFYELGEPDQASGGPSTGTSTPQLGPSPIVERSRRIHEVYLARLDPELAKHLTKIEVLPQIFLIRWIRLLFGREFPFDDLLSMWDILLAEDPRLDLVDMICVAMLLRIRWELIEANYSVALMLLLKYPAPEPPNGPQTFVSDAMFLRDNFSPAGGAKIINKYSGKAPIVESVPRPITPLELKRNPSGSKSPLLSPARFLQQQRGVEALFQGAAKGVFERGERLGINQAVRDAVGEVKKGLQASRNNSVKRTPEASRWPLEEGKVVPSTRASVSALKARNAQLARMLDQAMSDLRAVSVSPTADKELYVKAMDIAIAKVDFVKIYLEDATMPLPESPVSHNTALPSSLISTSTLQAQSQGRLPIDTQEAYQASTSGLTKSDAVPKASENEAQKSSAQVPSIDTESAAALSPLLALPPNEEHEGAKPKETELLPRQPKAPVPTRSSIAQSSFSWMLEPDVTSDSASKSSPTSSSPFQKSARRAAPNRNREKSAFLFGEDGEESSTPNTRLPDLVDAEDSFGMGPLRGSKNK